ncbi:hypothetical protein SCP_0107810 [Sparassis crispa]|uniref:Uncharacterized protein n=1 Tax=Sparassis crispa TaxID=139825 RepID=A0A401G6X3_9APHY|nr:hypothetical protein SCP_0107810 [Sparassis crispa]GBE77899.1 hypothetical protein SCP_0107810 [Sparassis crispa]
MGSLCSKESTLSEGQTVVPRPIKSTTRAVGQGPDSQAGHARPDPRIAAAEAAERRLKGQQARGTHASNPNRGKLAAQLEASKSAVRAPEPRQEDRLVWD